MKKFLLLSLLFIGMSISASAINLVLQFGSVSTPCTCTSMQVTESGTTNSVVICCNPATSALTVTTATVDVHLTSCGGGSVLNVPLPPTGGSTVRNITCGGSTMTLRITESGGVYIFDIY